MKNRKPVYHSMITRSMSNIEQKNESNDEEEIENNDEEVIEINNEEETDMNYTKKSINYYFTLPFLAIILLLFIINDPMFYMVFYVASNIFFPLP